jgi:alginate O-acetyltransferase complex protein AlgI
MLFNSIPYLIFFTAVFGLYWLTPFHKARLGLLLAASWFFYAWWNPPYLVLFLIVTLVNYVFGLAVGAKRDSSPRAAHALMVFSIVFNLALLGYFKYTNFLLDSVGSLTILIRGEGWEPPRLNIFLPLGISFYTFQMLAYVVDVRNRRCDAVRNPLKMSLFIAFFPQLIAGPIVRTTEFLPQLASKRAFDWKLFRHGLDLIALGVLKKVLIADQISPFVDEVFGNPGAYSGPVTWLAVYAYAVQIYCDFSGYTDIGRGSAACLGYKLPINFARPYLAGNIVDFWRRWHITLSTWLRDYLYIPLGGSRRGPGRTYLNLLLTMTLGGLWHGASWPFVIWGLYHGGALAVTRWVHNLAGISPDEPLVNHWLWKSLAVVGTFHLVCFGWIFFRAVTFTDAFMIIRGLFDWSNLDAMRALSEKWFRWDVALGALAVLPAAHLGAAWLRARGTQATTLWSVARPLFYGAVVAGALLAPKGGDGQFIYFQF